MDKDTAKDCFFAIVEQLKECQNTFQRREKLIDAEFEFFDNDDDESSGEIAQEL